MFRVLWGVGCGEGRHIGDSLPSQSDKEGSNLRTSGGLREES